MTIGSNVFVMYAVQDADAEDEVAGVGNGRIDAFDVNGNFVQTIVDGGLLNAPWGSCIPTVRSRRSSMAS